MVKKFFKMFQTRNCASPLYLETKTKRILAKACLGKKLVFHTEICEFREEQILKTGHFHRVKNINLD